jgi:hypothetical protein
VLGEAEPEGRALVILDDTEGIYLSSRTALAEGIERGDVVEAEGVSDPGGFAPCVALRRLVKVGSGRIPEPRRVTFEELLGGRLDAQWVEVAGIVRRMEPMAGNPRHSTMDLATGALDWEGSVATPKGATELERVTDIVGEPAALGREICAAAYQGRVACYDALSGNQIWTREMSTLSGVAFDPRYAFVSDDKGAVHALDRGNGRSIWKQDRLAYRRLSLPLPLGTEVAVGDLQGYVHFLARESGAFLARAATDGSAIRAAPIKLPDGFLVQTQNGGLYALALN